MMLLLSIFKWTLYSSLLGSVLACIILFCKFLFRERLGIKWSYCVWLLLVARLLIPYAPQSPLSIFNLLDVMQNNFTKIGNLQNYTIVGDKSHTDKNKLSISKSNEEETQIQDLETLQSEDKSNASGKTVFTKDMYFKIACIIWIIGVGVFGSYTLITIIKFSIKLRDQQFCEDKNIIDVLENCKYEMRLNILITVIHTDQVKSPAIFGIISPRLLLPKNINKYISIEEFKYIFFHELAHLKRKDIITRLVICFLQTLHWFNPIIGYSFYRLRQDMELACDAKALSYVKPDEYLKYGSTIIKLLEGYTKKVSTFGMACIISDRSLIKRRITMISLFKKNSYRWTIASVIILIVLGCLLLTNGRQGVKPNDNKINDIQRNAVIKAESNKEKNTVSEYEIQAKNFNSKILEVSNPEKLVTGFSRQIPEANETTSEIAKDNNAVCAINAGGFKLEGTNGKSSPSGIIIHDGNIIYSDSKNENTNMDIVGFDNNGKLIVGKHTLEELKQTGIKEAVSFGPALVIDGKPQITEGDGGLGVGPRSAIGQKKDGTILLVTIDGRSKESPGVTLLELQNIFIQFGAINASNLDGGSSSTMYYNGNIINHLSDALGERKVPSAFVVLP